MLRRLLALALCLIPSLGWAASSNVNSLTASSAIVGTQLTYCPVGATTDYKCTFTQVDAFINAQFSGDVTVTGTGTATVAKVGGVAPGAGSATALGVAPGANGGFALAAAPTTVGTGGTISGAYGYYICTTTCAITLPTPVAGFQFCIRNDSAVTTVITISAITSVLFEKTTYNGYGTVTTGTMVSGGALGDKICLVGRDATHYLVGSYVGTWTNS